MSFSKLRTILIIVVCIAGILLLFGCNTNNNNSTEPTAEPTELPTDEPDPTESPYTTTHVSMKITDEGYDIYAPLEGCWGYRYGPSIIYYEDGTMDAWFATPGTTGEWDWFTYKHYDGTSWSQEKVVLQPTPDSMDHYSVCDPGVVYFKGYYYLGYTSCIVDTNGGINNNVYVARSHNPDGPFEKWNGSGWGGDPQPIIYYDECADAWGAGEPSFVLAGSKLYIYYTWSCSEGSSTRVCVADTSENWPATMEYKGICYYKDSAQDSADVAYLDEYGKFIAFSTYQRFTASSGICIYESNDGIHFEKTDIIRTGTYQYLHNMGVSKKPNGHFSINDNLLVGYAYSDGSDGNWGKWATRFQSIELIIYDGDITSQDEKRAKGTVRTDYFWDQPEELEPVGITTNPHLIELHLSDKKYTIPAYWFDTTITAHEITDTKNVSFDNYDTSIISIKGLTMTIKGVGKTEVTMHYKGFQITFKVYIRPDDFIIDDPNKTIVSVRAVEDELTIPLKEDKKKHTRQVRGYVVFSDDTWGECYADSTKKHPDYPPMVPIEDYPVTYTIADESIAKVNSQGVVTPKAVGTTTVTATFENGMSYTVTIHVVEETTT